MAHKTKVVLISPTLSVGGMERCVSILLHHLDRKMLDIELVTIFDQEPFFPIPSDVPWHVLEKTPMPNIPSIHVEIPLQSLSYSADLAWLEVMAHKLADVITVQKTQVVLAFNLFCGMLSLYAKKHAPSIKVIVVAGAEIASDFRAASHGELYKQLARTRLCEADGLITASASVAEVLQQSYSIPAEKITLIQYPIDVKAVQQLAKESVDHPFFSGLESVILAVGRLAPQKGFDLLLQALARVRAELPARCVIIGEGPQEDVLRKLALELGIAPHVAFLGFQQNPFKYMQKCTVFAFPSRWEGFGYALVEALACGCPIVASNCPYGPSEILAEGTTQYGLLVSMESPPALAEGILKLLRDPQLREQFARLAPTRALAFDAPQITSRYTKRILRLLSGEESNNEEN